MLRLVFTSAFDRFTRYCDKAFVDLQYLGIFWGKISEESYYATAYHKYLLKMPFYRNITIRNVKTFDKIGQMLKKIIKEIHNDIFR